MSATVSIGASKRVFLILGERFGMRSRTNLQDVYPRMPGTANADFIMLLCASVVCCRALHLCAVTAWKLPANW